MVGRIIKPATPTEADKKAAELLVSDQELFAMIGQANEFIYRIENTPVQVPFQDAANTKVFKDYKQLVEVVTNNLYDRQSYISNAILDNNYDVNQYLRLDGLKGYAQKTKDKVVEYFNWGLSLIGIGAAPVVVIAVAAAGILAITITVAVIVDMLTDSTAEKKELMNSTLSMCEQLGMSKEECKSFMVETMPAKSDASNLFGTVRNVVGILAFAGVAFFLLNRASNDD